MSDESPLSAVSILVGLSKALVDMPLGSDGAVRGGAVQGLDDSGVVGVDKEDQRTTSHTLTKFFLGDQDSVLLSVYNYWLITTLPDQQLNHGINQQK